MNLFLETALGPAASRNGFSTDGLFQKPFVKVDFG